MSKAVNRLLHRMIQPNADLRCYGPDALADAYWMHHRETASSMHSTYNILNVSSIANEHLRTGGIRYYIDSCPQAHRIGRDSRHPLAVVE